MASELVCLYVSLPFSRRSLLRRLSLTVEPLITTVSVSELGLVSIDDGKLYVSCSLVSVTFAAVFRPAVALKSALRLVEAVI